MILKTDNDQRPALLKICIKYVEHTYLCVDTVQNGCG